MSVRFDPARRPVLVPVLVFGPRDLARLSLVVDTGAMRTIIRTDLLRDLGYDPAAGRSIRLRSATGGGTAREVTVTRLDALDESRAGFRLVAHDLPPTASGDGLLGLDYFTGRRLCIDFAAGVVALRRPGWWRVIWG